MSNQDGSTAAVAVVAGSGSEVKTDRHEQERAIVARRNAVGKSGDVLFSPLLPLAGAPSRGPVFFGDAHASSSLYGMSPGPVRYAHPSYGGLLSPAIARSSAASGDGAAWAGDLASMGLWKQLGYTHDAGAPPPVTAPPWAQLPARPLALASAESAVKQPKTERVGLSTVGNKRKRALSVRDRIARRPPRRDDSDATDESSDCNDDDDDRGDGDGDEDEDGKAKSRAKAKLKAKSKQAAVDEDDLTGGEAIDDGFLRRAEQNELNLYAARSTAHALGDGLFAGATFKAQEPLFELRGVLRSGSAFEAFYGTRNPIVAPWAFPLKPAGYLDARDQPPADKVFLLRGRLHVGRSELADNCRIEQRGRRLFVIANVDIYRTSELFCDFGEAYWSKPMHRLGRLLYFYLAVSPDVHHTPFEVCACFCYCAREHKSDWFRVAAVEPFSVAFAAHVWR
jgi:hypothetical protein